MNEFDFLSRIPLGQYVPTNSVIHKLDPRTKIVSLILLVIVISFTKSIIGVSIGLAFAILLTILSKVNLKFALKSVWASFPFLLLFAVIQVFFFSSVKDPQILFSWWKLRISVTGLIAGGILLMRFAALILLLTLASFSISTSELTNGAQRLLNPLNYLKIKTMDLVMVLQITLRFVPLLAQTAERIAKAQASRGADWGRKSKGLVNKVKQIIPLVVPLFTISLRRAENLALAMDARAYGYLEQRTSMIETKFTWRDGLAILIGGLISFAVLFA